MNDSAAAREAAAAVYQSVVPDFGFPLPGSEPDEDPYEIVARFAAPPGMDDAEICGRLFLATNSVERPWFENADRYALTDVKPARSTSVGDMVRIEDHDGVRFYRCEAAGWKRRETDDARVAVSGAPPA